MKTHISAKIGEKCPKSVPQKTVAYAPSGGPAAKLSMKCICCECSTAKDNDKITCWERQII